MLNSPVLILGYGREGQSVDAFLKTTYPELEVVVSDQTKPTTTREFITQDLLLNTERFFPIIVKSPGIPLHATFVQALIKKGSKLTSLTNLFFKHAPGKKIGVTGTKGKSTTCAIIASLLKEKYKDVRLVGNIGNPALDYLNSANKETIFVIELSSYQLETLDHGPEIAVLLQIHPEHLDYHLGFENYKTAKHKIYQNADILITFSNNEINSPAKIISYEEQSSLEAEQLKGNGNIQNLQAAIAVAKELGLTVEQIKSGIKNFKPLEHRLEYIGLFKGIHFYNDSLATIPEATIMALDALGPDVETLIAGGHDRGVNYEKLGKRIAESKLKTLILFPITGEKILEAANKHGAKITNVTHVENMSEAASSAYQYTTVGKICLMSPASSSLNLFKDYRDRAEQFIKEISK